MYVVILYILSAVKISCYFRSKMVAGQVYVVILYILSAVSLCCYFRSKMAAGHVSAV